MTRGYGGAVPRDARAFAFGLIQGYGGVEYPPRDIAKIVNERFGIKIKPKTVSNWKSKLPVEMEKYGITETDCREAVARGLVGDQRKTDDIEELQQEPEREEKIARGPEEIPVREKGNFPQGPLQFDSIASLISFVESQGFIIGKNDADIIAQLETRNLTVIENADKMLGVQDIFITPIELDMEIVGRNVVANPIIQFYYAIARKQQKDLDITAWITACIIDVYNNMDPPIKLAVLYG